MNRDFFLGALVAIALLMLWRKEHKQAMAFLPTRTTQPGAGTGAGTCSGCQASGYAAPVAQAAVDASMDFGTGLVSPSAPPLGGSGTSPAETSYMSQIRLWKTPAPGSYASGADIAPRAIATAPTYSNQAFVNRASARNLGTGRNALLIN